MKISLIQTDIAWNNPVENIRRCSSLANEALQAQSQLLIFPEMFTCGFSLPTGELAKESEARGREFLQDFTTRNKVYAVGTTPELSGDGRLYNTAWLAAPDGSISSYRKIHLFSFGDETKIYSPGFSATTTTLYPHSADSIRCTIFICYDLRFAEPFLLRAPETDLFVVMANWPVTRREHWLTLLRARAIETQCFVVGVNRVGSGGGLEYGGDSATFAPDGSEMVLMGNTAGASSIVVEAHTVSMWREKFPPLRDRRPDVYKSLRGN